MSPGSRRRMGAPRVIMFSRYLSSLAMATSLRSVLGVRRLSNPWPERGKNTGLRRRWAGSPRGGFRAGLQGPAAVHAAMEPLAPAGGGDHPHGAPAVRADGRGWGIRPGFRLPSTALDAHFRA